MKFALYDDHRPGAFDPVTRRVSPLAHQADHDADSRGWWSRLCGEIHQAAVTTPAEPVGSQADVVLRAPVLRPGKIIAAASNYAAHVEEMRTEVLPRNGVTADPWLLDFDVFLKAPSSIADPGTDILIPSEITRSGAEVHHEGELAVVIGRGGQRIEPSSALDHVLGYTIALDVTLRGPGDRSRRKSYDTFTPIGPWITTKDEIEDWRSLVIDVRVNGASRQHVTAGEMLYGIPELISYISSVMRLEPGDVILTGAPPGVGEIRPGDVVEVTISQLGTLTMGVALSLRIEEPMGAKLTAGVARSGSPGPPDAREGVPLSLRLAALALLSATPMTGYDLVKYFDENVGLLWAAPHSQIYPELRRMREDGLIQAEEVPRGQNATKQVYSVTDAGHAYLRELVAQTAPYPAERDLHRLKLAYAELAELDDARRQLEVHREHWQRRAEISERLLRGAREGSWPLLVERLKHTPPEQREAVVAFKVLAFEGQVARARTEIEWARRGLALIERLRHSGERETTGDAPSPG